MVCQPARLSQHFLSVADPRHCRRGDTRSLTTGSGGGRGGSMRNFKPDDRRGVPLVDADSGHAAHHGWLWRLQMTWNQMWKRQRRRHQTQKLQQRVTLLLCGWPVCAASWLAGFLWACLALGNCGFLDDAAAACCECPCDVLNVGC
eukprot:TRINITY_DN969_c0_g1_i1.p1 TRINITY_DN969_c0_g1~~TRINITY_DN969_c0_g1_i1.p1  ORF type:complete len:146 (+),score=9.96 TRINITY_DN969_c0_g1_i1:82-519(+)